MLTCSACGFAQNREGARFCAQCAAPLASFSPNTCPRCGSSNLPGARFCSNCAHTLTRASNANTGLLPPSTLLQARYRITRKLGQGGMGAVYQAQDTRLRDKLLAIKEMSDAQIADPAERTRAVAAFQREAELLATLDHANLPKVSDTFQERGRYYLVMDFIEGQTLEQIVAASPRFLTEAIVLDWAEQLCAVLKYLHTRQPPIIFRDLKPANVMLARDGTIKLIDFGIARFFQIGKTQDTVAYGTMGYAAPEQFGTGQTDARSDIYALGVTLHFLLTQHDPASSPFNLPPIRNLNSQTSPHIEAAILRATKSAPVERFQHVKEFAHALRPPATAPRFAFSAHARTQTPTPPATEMIAIPEGDFMMGSEDAADEHPPRRVRLDAYAIDRFPVTNAQYQKFVQATGHRIPDHWRNGQIPPEKAQHPVVNVTWNDAAAFARWVGKRLPTEAEWEKAARGTDGRRYPWGNQFVPGKCNTRESRNHDTTPVAEYAPQGDSPYGVADLSGNVSEWCADYYDPEYYATAPTRNPRGPNRRPQRVLRGGAWNSPAHDVRGSARASALPYHHNLHTGFRCAKS